MLFAVLSGYALGLVIPLLVRMLKGGAGLAAALLPVYLFFFFLQFLPVTVAGEPLRFAAAWNRAAGVGADLVVDGFSLLFALIVCLLTALAALRWRDEVRSGASLARMPGVRLAAIFFLMSAALGACLADSLVFLAASHFLLSASGVLLLASEPAARNRLLAMPAGAVWITADFALLAGLIALYGAFGAADLMGAGTLGLADVSPPGLDWSAGLIVLAAALKAGLFPMLSVRARLSDLPVSAMLGLVFAGLVPASMALVFRLAGAFVGQPVWSGALLAVGTLGLLAAAPRLLLECRVGRLVLLAGSALSALTFLLMGLGSSASIIAAAGAVLLHATSLAGLALCAGVLTDRYGAAGLGRLDGIWLTDPFLTGVWALGALSIGGLFPSVGLIVLNRSLELGPVALGSVAAASLILFGFFCLGVGLLRVPRAFMSGQGTLEARGRVRIVSLGLAFALCCLAGVLGLRPQIAQGLFLGPAVRALAAGASAQFSWGAGAILGLLIPWSSLAILAGLYLWREPEARSVLARRVRVFRLPTVRSLNAGVGALTGAELAPAVLRYAVVVAVMVALAGLFIGALGGLVALPWYESVAGRPFDPWFVVVGAGILSAALAARMPRLGHGALFLGAAGALAGLLLILSGAKSLGFALILVAGLEAGLLILWTQGLAAGPELPRRGWRRVRDGVIAALAGLIVFGLAMPYSISLRPETIGERIGAPAIDAATLLAGHIGASAALALAAAAFAAALWIGAAGLKESGR